MTETAVLGESGRIVVPASIRNQFGLKAGDRLTFIAKDGRIELQSMRMAIEELRSSILAEHGSLEGILDEFLAEKHEQAEREFVEAGRE